MLSKNKAKLIRSLGQKKNRQEHGLFVAEGPKVVGDLLEIGTAEIIVATEDWEKKHAKSFNGRQKPIAKELVTISEEELRKISFLQHPQEVLAVFRMAEATTGNPLKPLENSQGLSLALDGIQDPGNLGTIIRVADWFGINTIYCSEDTADVYNPKVVQATMGSIARVKVVYTDLPQFIRHLPQGYPVYATLLDGEDIYRQELTPQGLIIMGNEGNGISPEVRSLVSHRLFIPSYSTGTSHAESLNVAIATAITCAEFKRRNDNRIHE